MCVSLEGVRQLRADKENAKLRAMFCGNSNSQTVREQEVRTRRRCESHEVPENRRMSKDKQQKLDNPDHWFR